MSSTDSTLSRRSLHFCLCGHDDDMLGSQRGLRREVALCIDSEAVRGAVDDGRIRLFRTSVGNYAMREPVHSKYVTCIVDRRTNLLI